MTDREERLTALLTRFLPFCEGCGGSGWSYRRAVWGVREACPVCAEARELLNMPPAGLARAEALEVTR